MTLSAVCGPLANANWETKTTESNKPVSTNLMPVVRAMEDSLSILSGKPQKFKTSSVADFDKESKGLPIN
jgi:hypothetical protein